MQLLDMRWLGEHEEFVYPGQGDASRELLLGLAQQQKTVNPKFFYDERGSQLFDQITRLPEYYPTRSELAILQQYREQ